MAAEFKPGAPVEAVIGVARQLLGDQPADALKAWFADSIRVTRYRDRIVEKPLPVALRELQRVIDGLARVQDHLMKGGLALRTEMQKVLAAMAGDSEEDGTIANRLNLMAEALMTMRQVTHWLEVEADIALSVMESVLRHWSKRMVDDEFLRLTADVTIGDGDG